MSSQARQLNTAPRLSLEPIRAHLGWLGRGLGLVLIVSLLGMLLDHLADPATLPISKIRVQGALVHVTEPMLRKAISGKVAGGYFNIDVGRIREAVETLPWVKSASVKRIWPDAIAIQVVEQQALARWSHGGLINLAGEVFRPAVGTGPKHLPLLMAPKAMSQTVTEYYRDFNAQLATQDLAIDRIELDARRSIRLDLNNGIQLILGRTMQRQRLQRFIRVYTAELSTGASLIRRVDLRYSSGMAVQWRNINNGQPS